MLKKILKSTALAISAMLIIACSDTSNAPVAGKHYQVIDTPLDSYQLAPVTEAFSLTCPHCRSMEAHLPKLKELTNQEIGKTHVIFNEAAQIGAFIFYTAVMQLETVPDAAFMEDMFELFQNMSLTKQEQNIAISQMFEKRNLISPFDLDEAGKEKLYEYITAADEVMTKANIVSVPTFIVNGKYQIIGSGHKSIEEMATTINYLLEKKQ